MSSTTMELISAIVRCKGLRDWDNLKEISGKLHCPNQLSSNLSLAVRRFVEWCSSVKRTKIDQLVKKYLYDLERIDDEEGLDFTEEYWEVLSRWVNYYGSEEELQKKKEFLKKEVEIGLVKDRVNKINGLLHASFESSPQESISGSEVKEKGVTMLSVVYSEQNGVLDITQPYAFLYDGARYEVKDGLPELFDLVKPHLDNDKAKMKRFFRSILLHYRLEEASPLPQRMEFVSYLDNLLSLDLDDLDNVFEYREDEMLMHVLEFVCRNISSLNLTEVESTSLVGMFKNHCDKPKVLWNSYATSDRQMMEGCNALGCCDGINTLLSNGKFKSDIKSHAVALISKYPLDKESEERKLIEKYIQFGSNLPKSVRVFRANHGKSIPVILIWDDPQNRTALRKVVSLARENHIKAGD